MQILQLTHHADDNTFGTPVSPAISWMMFNTHITIIII